MMFTDIALLIYFADVVSNVGEIFNAAIILLCFFVFLIFLLHDDPYIYGVKTGTVIKNTIISIAALVVISALMPTKNVIYIFAGAVAAERIAADPKTAEISNKVIKAIEIKLDNIIQEQGTNLPNGIQTKHEQTAPRQ